VSFVLRAIDGRTCPIFVCDVCEERIDRAEDGAALWLVPSRGPYTDVREILHTHKGDCFVRMELKIRELRPDFWLADLGLAEHLYCLNRNCPTENPERAERNAHSLAGE